MSKSKLESYTVTDDKIFRELKVGDQSWVSAIENRADPLQTGYAAWWQSFLRGGSVLVDNHTKLAPVRVVDAFCGCGGLTLGAKQAAIAVGRGYEAVAAIDVDHGGLEVH